MLRPVSGVVGVLPLTFVGLKAWGGAPGIVSLLQTVFGAQCHQLPARMLSQAELPVCGRCLGIYLGVSAASIGYNATRRIDRMWVLFLIGTLAMLLDVLTERLRLRTGTPELRLVIGFIFAGPGTWLTLHRAKPHTYERAAVDG